MTKRLNNLNIAEVQPLISPGDFKKKKPLTSEQKQRIINFREETVDILTGKDKRLMVLTGPCSIHDPVAAMEYAGKLVKCREKYKERLNIVMRVYFEKPRTSIGWRGMILDPDMDGTNDIEKGLTMARELLLKINDLGLPAGSEILDTIVPQYIAELITWAAIGARTTESQTHREMTSGLSMPVGFKNATDGSLLKAVNAIKSSRHPHSFIGIDQEGKTSIFSTTGNPYGHLILRGGDNGANYHALSVRNAVKLMEEENITPSVMVDCSHENSGKDCTLQSIVLKDLLNQRLAGQDAVKGFMLESNLVAGNQKISKNPADMVYGKSITDECINWEETEELLELAYSSLEPLF